MMKNPLPDVRSLTSESGKGNEQLKVMNVSVFCRSHIRNFFEKSGKGAQPPLFQLVISLPLRFGLPRLFQQGLPILTEGVILPFLPLGLPMF